MLWVLNLSDGGHTLLDIAERAGLSFDAVHAAAQMLLRSELLAPAPEETPTQ
jgi:aminopeptidase-like protein